MLLSLKTIKRIESIKIEFRLALKKLSDGVHSMYEGLLISQHGRRIERIEFSRLKKNQILADAIELIGKIRSDTSIEVDKLDAKEKELWAQKQELHSALCTTKKDGAI